MTETKFQRLPFIQATDPPKIITVYRNGDAKNPGRKLVLNEKRILSWEAFLDNVTDRLKPTFGAVRRITTPHGSRKVGRTVDVEDGGHYVATGAEKFCHLPYLDISDRPPVRKKGPKFPTDNIQPVVHSKLQRSAKIRKINVRSKAIFVYGSGSTEFHRINLTPRELTKMEFILNEVSDKVLLPQGGAIHFLYTLEGDKVNEPIDLVNLEYYVAVGVRGFRRMNYHEHKKNFIISPRIDRSRIGRHRTLFARKSHTNGTISDQSTETSVTSTGATNSSTNSRRTVKQRDRNAVFPARPVRYKRNSQKRQDTDYDKDDSGVFKAHNQNKETRGAKEVEDTGETRVDLPIDQVEAEEVKEEFISGRETEELVVRIPSGIELTKLPSEDTELDTLTEEADNVCVTSGTELSKCPSDKNESNLVSETNGVKKESKTELNIHSAKSVPDMGSVKDVKSYSNLKTFDIASESNVVRKVPGKGKMSEAKSNVVDAWSKTELRKKDFNEFYRVSPENVYMACKTKLNTFTDAQDNQPDCFSTTEEETMQDDDETVAPVPSGTELSKVPSERNVPQAVEEEEEIDEKKEKTTKKGQTNNAGKAKPIIKKDTKADKKTTNNNKSNNNSNKTTKAVKSHPEPVAKDKPTVEDDTDDNKENEAATKIQSQYRGYQTRKGLKKTTSSNEPVQDTENEPPVKAATPIEPTEYEEKETMEDRQESTSSPRPDSGKETAKDDEVDNIPRSTPDGVKDATPTPEVTEPPTEVDDEDKEKAEAAARIQAGFRGYKARKVLKDQKEAALAIQASFRGFKTRRELKSQKEAGDSE